MLRLASSWAPRVAIAGAVALAAIYAGCNDLVTPVGGGDAGSDGPLDATALVDATPDTSEADAGLDVDATDANALDCTGQDAAFGAPNDLGCTGLYGDWAKKQVDPANLEFDPGLRMWTDGAESTRWVYVPPGQKIDTADMNEWKFPVGFKAWQELRLGGHRVETRHFWKRGDDDWVRTTYQWSDDERSAVSLTTGADNVGGTSYQIPAVAQCDQCHAGRIDRVLGFEAVSVSASASKLGGASPALTNATPLLTAPPASLAIPDDGSGRAAPALAWLHANCGTSCHNAGPGAFAGVTGLFLRLEVGALGLGTYAETATYATGVCQPARFTQDPPAGLLAWTRIRPHEDWTKSLVAFREIRRNDPLVQMPPIATSVPDLAGAKLVNDWITAGNFPTLASSAGKCP